MQDCVVEGIALSMNTTQPSSRLVTAMTYQALEALGEASSIALALAADFAAATTIQPIVATFHIARAASVHAVRTAASP